MIFDDERIDVNRDKLGNALKLLYTHSDCYKIYEWYNGRFCDAKRQHERYCYTSKCPFCEWTELMDWLEVDE